MSMRLTKEAKQTLTKLGAVPHGKNTAYSILGFFDEKITLCVWKIPNTKTIIREKLQCEEWINSSIQAHFTFLEFDNGYGSKASHFKWKLKDIDFYHKNVYYPLPVMITVALNRE